MEIPRASANNFKPPFQTAIVDLTFVVDAKGSVSAVKVLCASPSNPAFAAALLGAASDWHFAPAGQAEKVAYRVIVSGPSSELMTVQRIFLGAQPST